LITANFGNADKVGNGGHSTFATAKFIGVGRSAEKIEDDCSVVGRKRIHASASFASEISASVLHHILHYEVRVCVCVCPPAAQCRVLENAIQLPLKDTCGPVTVVGNLWFTNHIFCYRERETYNERISVKLCRISHLRKD
jgi:hypothetical protein